MVFKNKLVVYCVRYSSDPGTRRPFTPSLREQDIPVKTHYRVKVLRLRSGTSQKVQAPTPSEHFQFQSSDGNSQPSHHSPNPKTPPTEPAIIIAFLPSFICVDSPSTCFFYVPGILPSSHEPRATSHKPRQRPTLTHALPNALRKITLVRTLICPVNPSE